MPVSKYYNTLTLPVVANTPVDLRGYPNATLYATSAATSPYTLEISPNEGVSWIPQVTIKTSANSINLSPVVDDVASYALAKGDTHIRLTGGTGGEFIIVAGE